MKIKEQTVYIPTHNKSDFQIVDPTFGVSNAYVKTTYCLSKEELIELLSEAYNAGVDYDIFENTPTKEQFINQLIDNTKQ